MDLSANFTIEPMDIELVSEQSVAYLVHLIWTDARSWDQRRRISRDEALALAERLAAHLPVETRVRLETLRDRYAA